MSSPDRGATAAHCRQHLHAALRSIWYDQWRNPAPETVGIVLSGGVDTGAIAEALAELEIQPHVAITVYVRGTGATDKPYARKIAAAHRYRQHAEVEVAPDELLVHSLDTCVRHLRTFDGMELRNSIVVCRALAEARALSLRHLFTGDGSDELLGGYSFTWAQQDCVKWAEARAKMCARWTFSAPALARHFSLDVASPYMQPGFVDWALGLGRADCVGERRMEATPDQDRVVHVTGKLPLREAYPDAVSAWRRKDPIEVGSGSCLFGQGYFDTGTTKQAFENEARRALEDLHVVIRDAEHLHYFKRFQKLLSEGLIQGLPDRAVDPDSEHAADACIGCRYMLPTRDAMFCLICGAWPARKAA